MNWKQFIKTFLSEALLFAIAFAELVIVLIPILLSRNHAHGLWYEDNMIILGIEIGFFVGAMGWALFSAIRKVKAIRLGGGISQ